jgi:putative FmdB family regulatory protein
MELVGGPVTMPTYEYECQECGIRFDRFQHFSEDPLKTCPECEGPVRRVIHPVGIVFKGSGFYVTDNKSDTRSLTPKSQGKPLDSLDSGEAETKPTKESADSKGSDSDS